MSGSDEHEVRMKKPGDTCLGLLHKPFNLDAIREALEGTMRA